MDVSRFEWESCLLRCSTSRNCGQDHQETCVPDSLPKDRPSGGLGPIFNVAVPGCLSPYGHVRDLFLPLWSCLQTV